MVPTFNRPQAVYSAGLADPLLSPFLSTLYPSAAGPGELVLAMEDATVGLDPTSLCVMDVKLGTRTWVETVSTKATPAYIEKFRVFGVERASASKKDYMQWRDESTTTATLGYRVTGMTVRRAAVDDTLPSSCWILPDGDSYLAWCGAVGLSDSAAAVFRSFLHDGRRFHAEVARTFLHSLRQFREALTLSPLFHRLEFIGTSLLFAYDRRWRAGSDPAPAPGVVLRWIDFSNVYVPTVGVDDGGPPAKKDGVLVGVDSLIALFEGFEARCADEASECAGAGAGLGSTPPPLVPVAVGSK